MNQKLPHHGGPEGKLAPLNIGLNNEMLYIKGNRMNPHTLLLWIIWSKQITWQCSKKFDKQDSPSTNENEIWSQVYGYN